MNHQKLYKTAIKICDNSNYLEENREAKVLHGRTTNRHVKVYAIPPELLLEWTGATRIIAVTRSGCRWEGKKAAADLLIFTNNITM